VWNSSEIFKKTMQFTLQFLMKYTTMRWGLFWTFPRETRRPIFIRPPWNAQLLLWLSHIFFQHSERRLKRGMQVHPWTVPLWVAGWCNFPFAGGMVVWSWWKSNEIQSGKTATQVEWRIVPYQDAKYAAYRVGRLMKNWSMNHVYDKLDQLSNLITKKWLR
jgi:hypothetical protein